MPISSVLVTTDNYWIGGRETFLTDNLRLLKFHTSARTALLADSVDATSTGGIFDDIISLNSASRSNTGAWLRAGREICSRNRTELIWAHHYRLLPAWLLSQTLDLPLQVTFHGSLTGMGGVDSLDDALGVTLAIHRGGILTGVSKEVVGQLIALGADQNKVLLMPNKVSLPVDRPKFAQHRTLAAHAPIKLVMLTREQKLDHMREAVRLLHALRRQGYSAELTIYSGLKTASRRTQSGQGYGPLQSAKRLGRRWLLQNVAVLPDLAFVRFLPPTNAPMETILASDIVLGMGRVVLEGLAARKPTILIGYEKVIGLVTREKFSAYQETNFSGRGFEAGNLEVIIDETINAISDPDLAEGGMTALIDISSSWCETQKIYELARNLRSTKPIEPSIQNAVDRLLAAKIQDSGLIDSVRKTLSKKEYETYRALTSCVI